MTRPSEQPPAWATDANYDATGEPYDGTPTKVTPDAARKANGHEPSKRPPAQQFNWWQNLAYTWLQWLADLVLAPASKTALTVTVNAAGGTFTRSAGDFLADGFAAGQRVNWTGFTNGGNNVNRRLITGLSATVMTFADTTGLVNEVGDGNEAVSAWATIGGRLQVDQSAYFDQDVTIDDDVVITGELEVQGAELVVDGDLVLAGAFSHGDRTLTINPSGAAALYTAGGAWPATVTGAISTNGVDQWAIVAIPLKIGDRIKSVTFARKGDNFVDVDVTVLVSDSAGTDTSLGTVNLPNLSNVWGTTTIDVTDHTVAAGESLWLLFQPNAANGFLSTIQVVYDRP